MQTGAQPGYGARSLLSFFWTGFCYLALRSFK